MVSTVDTEVVSTVHIVKTPGIIGGDPRIDGHRIGVHDIALRYVHLDQTVDDIVEAFDLTPAQVHAALAYYYDHVEEIEAILAENERLAAEHTPYEPPPERRAEVERRYRERLANPDSELTVAEIADLYSLSTPTVRIAIKNGWLPARKSGSVWLIRRRDAQARWGKGKKRKGER